jgi:hypothetical protein
VSEECSLGKHYGTNDIDLKLCTSHTSEHRRHMHSICNCGALFRAICLCSCHEHFNHERLILEIIFVLNGYPSIFAKRTFDCFFKECVTLELWHSFDATSYQSLHRLLLMRSTRRKKRHQIHEKDKRIDCQVTGDVLGLIEAC